MRFAAHDVRGEPEQSDILIRSVEGDGPVLLARSAFRRLKLRDDVTVIDADKGLDDALIDILAEEPHRSVAQHDLAASCVSAQIGRAHV